MAYIKISIEEYSEFPGSCTRYGELNFIFFSEISRIIRGFTYLTNVIIIVYVM